MDRKHKDAHDFMLGNSGWEALENLENFTKYWQISLNQRKLKFRSL